MINIMLRAKLVEMKFKLQTKLIHFLGGYTKKEYETPSLSAHSKGFDKGLEHGCAQGFKQGIAVGIKQLANTLEQEANKMYGCSKQEWIDRLYAIIKDNV